MSAFVDTNILIRHLTGDPPEMAERATRFLGKERDLLLVDLVVAETIYVLESFYEAPRQQIDESIRSLIAFESIVCVDPALLVRRWKSARSSESSQIDRAMNDSWSHGDLVTRGDGLGVQAGVVSDRRTRRCRR